MRKATSYALCLMALCLVASPLHVFSFGGAPSFHPSNLLLEGSSQAAKEKMIEESDNEFTKQLFDEFNIDVYDGSQPIADRAKMVSTFSGNTEDVGFLPAIAGLIGAVNTAVNVATKIISFFGKQYSERLVGSFTENGYSKFAGSAKVMHGQGLPYSNVPRFLELLGKSRGVPDKYKTELLTIGKWAQYLSRTDLTKQTIEFSAGKGGDCKVLQFYIQNNREEQKLDLFVMTVENSFKLAPDVFVILEETSQFWGMKSSSKIRFEKRPANLSPDQIKFVSDYFSLIALEQLADFLSVDNGVPNMKPKKNKKSNMDVMGGDDNGYGSHTNLRVPATFQKHTERTIWKNNLKEYHPPKPQLKALMGYATQQLVDPDVFRRDFVSFDQDNRSDECHSICHKHMKLAKCKFTRTYEHCVIEKKIGYENCKYGCLSISMRGNEY